ncbi:hypothetical protein [Priestia aryabhattai]
MKISQETTQLTTSDFEKPLFESVYYLLRLFAAREGNNPNAVTQDVAKIIGDLIVREVYVLSEEKVELVGNAPNLPLSELDELRTKYLSNLLKAKIKETVSQIYGGDQNLGIFDRILTFVIYAQAGALNPLMIINKKSKINKSQNLFDECLYHLIRMYVKRQDLKPDLITREMTEAIGFSIIDVLYNSTQSLINLYNVRREPITRMLSEDEKLHLKYLTDLLLTESTYNVLLDCNRNKNEGLIDRVNPIINKALALALKTPLEIATNHNMSFFHPEITADINEYNKRNGYMPGYTFIEEETNLEYKLVKGDRDKYNLIDEHFNLLFEENCSLVAIVNNYTAKGE